MVDQEATIIDNKSHYPDYCVVIRTLGRAGSKFQQEIDSILSQNHKPKRILAYIPVGYTIPDISDNGVVEFVRSPKGMVAQRSLEFKEVDTDYILFMDDDVSLAKDSVEKLFDGLKEYDGDCIGTNVLPTYEWPLHIKVAQLLFGIRPHFSHKWGIKVLGNGTFSYNLRPQGVTFSQSNAGGCCLCKTNVYQSIRFEHERWLDMTGYPLGDDQLFFYKMYRRGYTVLTYYDIGVVHLDGKTSDGKKFNYQEAINRAKVGFLIWYRSCYSPVRSKSLRWWRLIQYILTQLTATTGDFLMGLKNGCLILPDARIKGMRQGYLYSKTDSYKNLPDYDAD